MSRDNLLRLLCYDVSNDKRRRKIAQLLEEQASRVQFSVFETRLPPKALQKLVAQVEKYLLPGDSLRVYTIGRAGERNCQVYGTGVPIETEAAFWLL